MSENNLSEYLQLAQATALLAGRQLRAHQNDWKQVLLEQGRDVKVKADKLAEDIILSQLQAATPFSILTEETGWHGKDSEEWIWIVDPLDGSYNYSQKIPFCCVAIALVQNGQPRLGVVYDFNHDEIFSGCYGKGAWLNSQPMHVSNIEKSQSAVLMTGFPAHLDPALACDEITRRGLGFKKMRMIGSAALALAYVAAGRADAYQELGTMFWDVAAGCALVQAAGGQFQLKGDIFNSPINAFANNGKLQFP